MSNAIVVRVPTAEQHCFVAIPSSDDFEAVAEAIDEAVLRTDLKPVKLPRARVGQDFIADITREIRSARVVIAVVTPETATGAPNPNVLYELGLACALGKPTLILTGDDPRNLPADLRNRHVVRYRGDAARSLADQIVEPLFKLLKRLASSILIDPEYGPDISLARAHHWRIIEPEWWDLLATTLRFAKDVHNAFQPFDTGQLDPLLRRLKDLLDAPVSAFQAAGVEEKWDEARNAYEVQMNSNGLSQPADRFDKVDEAYPKMLKMMPESPRRLTDSQKHYRAIKNGLERYPARIFQFDRGVSPPLRTRVRGEGGAEEIWGRIFELSQETKALIVSADHMLLALLSLMLEGE